MEWNVFFNPIFFLTTCAFCPIKKSINVSKSIFHEYEEKNNKIRQYNNPKKAKKLPSERKGYNV